MADYNAHALDVVKHAVTHLPPEFATANCWWQFSSSMGMKPGIRLHLWYWLHRAIDENEAKTWLASYPVDLALYNPVQPHYVAKPVFEDGIADPVTARSGLLDPTKTMSDTVAVPNSFPPINANRPSRGAVGVRGTTFAASREIIRDAQGLVVDGREWWLYLQSIEACRVIQAKGTDLATVNAKALADTTWELFATTTDLSDGRWTYSDAYEKAAYRVQDIAHGWRPSSQSNVPTLIPDIQPYYQLDPKPLYVAEAELAKHLDGFFTDLVAGKTPRLALNVTMGLGKTHQTAERVAVYIKTRPTTNVELYVPRHDLAAEIVERIRALAADAFDVIQVRGRSHHDEDGVLMCARYDAVVKQMVEHGISVTPNACYRSPTEKCQYYDRCPYWEQFRRKRQGTVRVMPHAYLALPRVKSLPDPDLVIIDEGPLPSLHRKHQVPLNKVWSHFSTVDGSSVGEVLTGALRNDQPVLKALRDAGFGSDTLKQLEFDHGRGVFTPGASDDTLNNAARKLDLRYARDLGALRDVLVQELEAHPTRDEATRVRYHAGFDAAFVNVVAEPSIPENVPLLLLDGTGNQTITASLFRGVGFAEVEGEPIAFVSQVYDRIGSNTFWSDDKHADELAVVANARAGFGHKVLVVGFKELADKLRSKSLHANVSVGHFNAIRGTNDYEDCDTVIIAGRNQPPATEVEALARAVFWKDDTPLVVDNAAALDAVNARLPTEARGYSVWGDRPACGVDVYAFSDERTEAVHSQLREAETMQAIERLRLVRAQERKRVLILSNLPLPLPVHQVCRWDDLVPETFDVIIAETGWITLSPIHLYALHSSRFKNKVAMAKALQRWENHFGYQDSLYRGSMLEVTYRLLRDGRPDGKRAKALVAQQSDDGHMALLSESAISDLLTAAFIESLLAPGGVHIDGIEFSRN